MISTGLVTWLVVSIGPDQVMRAAASPVMPWLVLATLVQLVVLLLWDSVALWWLFSQPDSPIPFRVLLRARTDSILWSAVNLEIGQGMFAWTLADIQRRPLSEYLSRCALLGIFDFGCVQAIALIGSFIHSDPLLEVLRWVPVASLGGLIVLALLLRFMPGRLRSWLEKKHWASLLSWWSWRHTLLLAAQRFVLFSLVIIYAGICLHICGMGVGVRTVVGVIPFVMIAEGLPGTGGLGERETALVFLLHPANENQRALLLTFGLTWSLVVIVGRLLIGLISRALPRRSSGGGSPSGSPSGSQEHASVAGGH